MANNTHHGLPRYNPLASSAITPCVLLALGILSYLQPLPPNSHTGTHHAALYAHSFAHAVPLLHQPLCLENALLIFQIPPQRPSAQSSLWQTSESQT